MRTLTVPVVVLAGVLASSAGAGGGREFVGPAALGARGAISGDVQGAQRGGFRLLVDAGVLTVTGSGLDVGCAGGESEARRVNGHLQVTCRGRGMRAFLAGSAFSFDARGERLGAVVPPGVTLRVTGDVEVCASRRCGVGRRPMRLSGRKAPPAPVAAEGFDVNGDGKVDPADVAALLRR